MKRKTAADLILMLVCMLLAALLLTPTQAQATSKPDPAPISTSSAQQAQHQTQAQQQAIDLSLMNAPAGASIRQGNSYSFVSGQAPALPPGLCPKSKSSYRSFVIFTWSDAENGTDMDCLEKVLQMLRDTAPKPVEVRYVSISQPPKVEVPAECKAPKTKKAKASKKTAATKPADDSCKRS